MKNEGWRTASLGDKDIALTASGGTPDRSDASNFGGDISWVKSGELDDNIIYATEEKLTEHGVQTSSAKLFPRGTLLVAMYGATAGRTAILGIEATTNQAVCAIFPQNGSFDDRFLQFQLMYDRPKLLNARSGGAQPNISQRVVATLDVVLPPVEEQRAIARALETVQQAKEARERELDLERERKAALMEYVFTHGTRSEPTQQTEIGEIPQSWKVKPLSSVADLVSGGTPFRENADWWKGAIPWASPKDMKSVRLADTQEHVSEEGIENGSRLVPSGTIFIVIRGMILAKDTPIALAEVSMAFNQDMKAVLCHEEQSSEYLLNALIWRKDGLAKHIGTSAHGTRRISTAAVDSLQLPIPPPDEQIEIARILGLCEAKIVALEREIPLHEELFRAILEELMTGRVSALPLIEEHQAQ